MFEAETLRLSLEQELQQMQADMASLAARNDDLHGQVAASREATAAEQSQFLEERSQLQRDRDAQRKQDRDDLLAAERELGALQKKLASALALASATEEERVTLLARFEAQRVEDAAQSAAAAELLVSEAVQREKDAARENVAEVRAEMQRAEEARAGALASKLGEEHTAAVRSMEEVASEALSAALAEAEKKRKDALAAAQHGHQVS